MNSNFSLKPGATTSTRLILNLLKEKDWSLEELVDATGLFRGSIYSNLTYYVKIKLVEKTGVKPNYIYKLKR